MVFFFSSRRRHTRCSRDWSSDVCSSDLCLSGPEQLYDFQRFLAAKDERDAAKLGALWGLIHTVRWPFAMAIARSEERRVGKEWRCRWWTDRRTKTRIRAKGQMVSRCRDR